MLQTFSFAGNCSLWLGYLWYLLEFGIVLFCRKIVRANNWILHLQIYSFLLIEMRSIFANTHPHESISKVYFWKENPPLIKCYSMTIHLSQTKIPLNRFLQRWVALKNVMTIGREVMFMLTWTMFVLRTKSWIGKVEGRSDQSSLHQAVTFLIVRMVIMTMVKICMIMLMRFMTLLMRNLEGRSD